MKGEKEIVSETLTREYLKGIIEDIEKKHDITVYVNEKGQIIFDEPLLDKDVLIRIIKQLANELAKTKAELWASKTYKNEKEERKES